MAPGILSSLTNRVQGRTVTNDTAHISKGKTGISEMYILSVLSAAIESPSVLTQVIFDELVFIISRLSFIPKLDEIDSKVCDIFFCISLCSLFRYWSFTEICFKFLF